jgi:hypothetical protein
MTALAQRPQVLVCVRVGDTLSGELTPGRRVVVGNRRGRTAEHADGVLGEVGASAPLPRCPVAARGGVRPRVAVRLTPVAVRQSPTNAADAQRHLKARHAILGLCRGRLGRVGHRQRDTAVDRRPVPALASRSATVRPRFSRRLRPRAGSTPRRRGGGCARRQSPRPDSPTRDTSHRATASRSLRLRRAARPRGARPDAGRRLRGRARTCDGENGRESDPRKDKCRRHRLRAPCPISECIRRPTCRSGVSNLLHG